MNKREFLEAWEIEKNDNLPCRQCWGDCCGVVPFTKKEIKEIKKKYRKKLRGLKTVKDENGQIYFIKAIENNQCPFYNKKENKCDIYDARPIICKAYGQTPFLVCPYEGLKEIPEDEDIQIELTKKAQEKGTKFMAELFGIGEVNLIDVRVKNVINRKKFPNLIDGEKKNLL